MKAQQKSEAVPFTFYVPIAKVDRETRLVTGVVTQEILDKQGDIVDYETAKTIFSDDALWPGNMREMHQPKAVGKRVGVEFDDDNKTITLTSRVSKGAPDTWEKVLDETLSFYSIGGSGERVAEKTAEGKIAKRLFLKSLAEVSYVDNGACPTAKFEIVKTVGGKLTDAEPADEVETEPKKDEKKEEAAAPIDKALAAVKAATTTPVTQIVCGTDGKAFVITVADASTVAKAVATLGREGRGQDRAVVKANIIAAALTMGDDAIAELPEAWKPVEKRNAERAGAVRKVDAAVQKFGPECWDIDNALAVLSAVERMLSSEWWEAYSAASQGVENSVEVAQVKLLKQAAELLMQFLMSEWDEQFNDTGASVSFGFSDDTVVEMFVKAFDVVTKAGARHSKKDVELIQSVHDAANGLGANCSTDHVDKAAIKGVLRMGDGAFAIDVLSGDAVIVKGIALVDADGKTVDKLVTGASDGETDITKLQADLTATKSALDESKAAVTKAVETAAALEVRMKVLEDQPVGGGPARRVVDKTTTAIDGSAGADGGAQTVAGVIAALEGIAKSSSNGEVKREIAVKIASISRAGAGRINVETLGA